MAHCPCPCLLCAECSPWSPPWSRRSITMTSSGCSPRRRNTRGFLTITTRRGAQSFLTLSRWGDSNLIFNFINTWMLSVCSLPRHRRWNHPLRRSQPRTWYCQPPGDLLGSAVIPQPCHCMSQSHYWQCCSTDYLWAQTMGYTGAQYDDSDGLSVGE